MQQIHGVIKHYDWGDRTFLPALLQQEPDGRPWAELWLGTHPSGPAVLDDGTPLVEVTGKLDYLLKVLSCASPLSLQTHPSAEQAAEGFAHGVFKDPNPKPELLYALTPFQAFCGVRPVEATLALLNELGATDLADALATKGPSGALQGLYRGSVASAPAVRACSTSSRPEAKWVRELDARYPSDPSVAVTLLLNLVELAPGETIRLGTGNLHAYLQGSGIELMAASDNVVRGGLTNKEVNIDLLLETIDPTPIHAPVLPPGDHYVLPEIDIALIRLTPGQQHRAAGDEIMINALGIAHYLPKGHSFIADDVTYVATRI